MTAIAFLVAAAGGCKSSSLSGDRSESSDKTEGSSKNGGSSDSRQSSKEATDVSAVVSWTILGVVVVAAVIWLVVVTTDEPEKEEARAYLEAHRRSIRVSLARGSGPFIQNVAMVLGVPVDELPILASAIHARRDALDRWLMLPQISADDARGFSADLREALMTEPRLVRHVEAAHERLTAALGASP